MQTNLEIVTEHRPLVNRFDLAIVGGGIVGLATAREFLLRRPNLRVVVLEKEQQLATHQSGHNSGVIHAGIYYTPGSLKAKACVEGHDLMIEYCRSHDILFELCGKVIVALDENEIPRLNDLFQRGMTNGVKNLEMIGPERLHELEPFAAGIKAIYSPNTGIIDYRQVALSYASEIQSKGGEIVTDCLVTGFTSRGNQNILSVKNSVKTNNSEFEITANYVITCGGLQADKLSNLSHKQKDFQIVPFRGDYYVLRPEKRYMTRGMIYPVPDPRFPFLGVHFTKRIDGQVWAGPNAVLAFAREGYKRTQIDPVELARIVGFKGFRKLAGKYLKKGLDEMYRDYYKAAFVKALQRYMPALQSADLLPGPSGVRAQALGVDGSLVDDFVIQRGENILHVQNAPSPAATSSLVIARMIADAAKEF